MAVTGAFMVPHPPLIIPLVGRGEERLIQNTTDAYEEAGARIALLKPETIVIASPHSVMYSDYFHISPGNGANGDFGQFRAGGVRIEAAYDREFVNRLSDLAARKGLPAGTRGEREKRLDHGTLVPLFFVNRHYRGYRLVRIGLSGLSLTDHYRLGQCIRQAAEELGRNVVFLASGDLSHKLKEDGPYGFAEEGPVYDQAVMEVMGRGDFLKLFDFPEAFCENAAECGHRSFVILAGALDRTRVKAQQLSYEGPFGVGYGICAYETEGPDDSRSFLEQYEEKERLRIEERRRGEDAYTSLARRALEEYIRRGITIGTPEGTEKELTSRKAGTFVSLHKNGRLRGCIGTIGPTKRDIASEIISNAISAGTRDPRFPPVEEEELKELVYSVDVLGETEEIASRRQLDVKKYGVIVTKGLKRGLLLPNLEGVDTVEQQIAIAKRKAGIREDEEDVKLERFEVVRHE